MTEEEWEQPAASSAAELARSLGVSKKWVRTNLRGLFGSRAAEEQTYQDTGQYRVRGDGGLQWLPGHKATWVTNGQAQVLAEFAKDVRWKMSRRNGPVIRYKVGQNPA